MRSAPIRTACCWAEGRRPFPFPVSSFRRVCRETAEMSPVEVRPKESSVHLGSYPSERKGDRPLEASGTGGPFSGSASVRAATRVKPEQASKSEMRMPSLHDEGEGRWLWSEQPIEDDQSTAGVMGAARTHTSKRDTGDLPWCDRSRNGRRGWPTQESEGLIVALKPGNAGGAKEPWFRVRLEEPRIGRSA